MDGFVYAQSRVQIRDGLSDHSYSLFIDKIRLVEEDDIRTCDLPRDLSADPYDI
jgi:hypothetical protein